MPTTARLRRPFLALTLVSTIAACSGATSGKPAPTAAVAPSAAPGSIGAGRRGSSDAWLVVGRPGEDRLHVILASTEEEMLSLPIGAPDERLGPRHRRHAGSVRHDGGGPPGGSWLRRTRARGRRILAPADGRPRPGPGRPLRGRLDDRAGRGRRGHGHDRLEPVRSAVADARSGRRASSTCPGPSNSTRSRPMGRCSTSSSTARSAGRSLPGPGRGDRDGRPAARRRRRQARRSTRRWPAGRSCRTAARTASSSRCTAGAEHPFIHALNSVEAWAVCIDLPAAGADDAEAALDWGLTRRTGRARHPGRQRDARASRSTSIRATSRSSARSRSILPPRAGSRSPSSGTSRAARSAGGS